jgi:hypothetical protein
MAKALHSQYFSALFHFSDNECDVVKSFQWLKSGTLKAESEGIFIGYPRPSCCYQVLSVLVW